MRVIYRYLAHRALGVRRRDEKARKDTEDDAYCGGRVDGFDAGSLFQL